jgi:hypothetical protein
MDEIEFNELYNRVADVIVKWLGIEKQDIIDNINQYFKMNKAPKPRCKVCETVFTPKQFYKPLATINVLYLR